VEVDWRLEQPEVVVNMGSGLGPDHTWFVVEGVVFEMAVVVAVVVETMAVVEMELEMSGMVELTVEEDHWSQLNRHHMVVRSVPLVDLPFLHC
jgi:hypothetical protein